MENKKKHKKKGNKKIKGNKLEDKLSIPLKDLQPFLEKVETKKMNLIMALATEPTHRRNTDIDLLSEYLQKSELGNKFHSENLDNEILNKMLNLCSKEIRIKLLKENEALFHFGEKGDNFYIIFNGIINIVKPNRKTELLTGFEYIKQLMILRDRGEIPLLQEVVAKNNYIINIEEQEIPLLEYILFKIISEEDDEKDINLIKNLEMCGIKSTELKLKKTYDLMKIDLSLMDTKSEQIEYLMDLESSVKKRMPFLSANLMKKYKAAICPLKQKRNFMIASVIKILSLFSDSFFGDVAIDGKTTRNASIEGNCPTILGYLSCRNYHTFIQEEKQKLTDKEIHFLTKNFFFRSIKEKHFHLKYYSSFHLFQKRKGDIIFKVNTPVDAFYFIKEGAIEVNWFKSYQEIFNIITHYQTQFNQMCSSFDSDTTEKKKPIQILLKNPYTEQSKELKIPTLNKIISFAEKQSIGPELYFFKSKFPFSGVAATNVVKYFKIDIQEISMIFEEEKGVIQDFKNYAFKRMSSLIERFIDVFYSRTEVIDRNLYENQHSSDPYNILDNPLICRDLDKKDIKSSNSVNFLSEIKANRKKSKILTKSLTKHHVERNRMNSFGNSFGNSLSISKYNNSPNNSTSLKQMTSSNYKKTSTLPNIGGDILSINFSNKSSKNKQNIGSIFDLDLHKDSKITLINEYRLLYKVTEKISQNKNLYSTKSLRNGIFQDLVKTKNYSDNSSENTKFLFSPLKTLSNTARTEKKWFSPRNHKKEHKEISKKLLFSNPVDEKHPEKNTEENYEFFSNNVFAEKAIPNPSFPINQNTFYNQKRMLKNYKLTKRDEEKS